jgi:hypothetical protein
VYVEVLNLVFCKRTPSPESVAPVKSTFSKICQEASPYFVPTCALALIGRSQKLNGRR